MKKRIKKLLKLIQFYETIRIQKLEKPKHNNVLIIQRKEFKGFESFLVVLSLIFEVGRGIYPKSIF